MSVERHFARGAMLVPNSDPARSALWYRFFCHAVPVVNHKSLLKAKRCVTFPDPFALYRMALPGLQ